MSRSLPSSSLVSLMYIIYGLHAFSAISGLLSPALIITTFLTGWPSILAVLLSYYKRFSAQGTYLESHFAFVIQTFWLAFMWLVISGILIVTVIGAILGFAILLIVGVWLLYRLLKGMSYLIDEKPIPNY